MKLISLVVAGVLVLTSCGPINLHPTEVMPTTSPTVKKLLDCDLIFPAPAQDTLTP